MRVDVSRLKNVEITVRDGDLRRVEKGVCVYVCVCVCVLLCMRVRAYVRACVRCDAMFPPHPPPPPTQPHRMLICVT